MKKDSKLPFVPNYLANPPFPFVYTLTAEDSALLHKGGLSIPPASPTVEPLHGTTPLDPGSELRCVCPLCHTQNIRKRLSATSESELLPPPVSLEPKNGMHIGSVPAFHPFFFTRAFPFNMQELVLKVRIQKVISLKLNWTNRSSPTKNCSE
ncbi:hypothetical protein HPG69_005778 [Diceros bicornis minor]|uniref:Uncharacterized protein n=1 Tax=Diceros bicornis minor TaxID=77932 RepID=A0A7J7ESG2_DICBM|nr:hypothetical protein HPG69_005778 [Diceros bicornis minor]